MIRGASRFAVLSSLAMSCAYSVPDVVPTDDDAGTAAAGPGTSSVGEAASSGTSGAAGTDAGPGCPEKCPIGSTCDTMNGWCQVEPQPTCDPLPVTETARFHGDTCQGVAVTQCTSTGPALVFEMAAQSGWSVQVSRGGTAGDLVGDCMGGQLGCGQRIELEPGARLGVRRLPTCGPVTIDIVAR
jgi:hypothetical protein